MQVTRKNNLELVTYNVAEDEEKTFVMHQGAVAIIAVKDEHIILVKQYRYPIGELLLEIPAGKIESGETALQTAQRELLEETGFQSNNLEYIGEFYTTPGFSNQNLHFYFTDQLTKKVMSDVYGVDSDEEIKVVLMKLDEFVNGQTIRDMKTEYAKKVINERYSNQ